MNKDEIVDLIRDAGFGVLASCEGDQPRCRPMMPYFNEDDGALYLAVLGHSRTIEQIKANPKIEICYVDRKMCFARISGAAKVSEDKEKKEAVWNGVPMLRQYFSSTDDPNFVLIEIDSAQVEAMSPQQKTPDVVSFK